VHRVARLVRRLYVEPSHSCSSLLFGGGLVGVCLLKGGLLVDLGVLSLKALAIPAAYFPTASSPIPRLPPSHPAIVEWRAMTVIEL
jgi:Protein of unknown function (DUF1688)